MHFTAGYLKVPLPPRENSMTDTPPMKTPATNDIINRRGPGGVGTPVALLQVAMRRLLVRAVIIVCLMLPLATVPPAARSQTQITAVSTTNQTVTASNYSVKGKTVNHGNPAPGNDLWLEGFTANNVNFEHERTADQIVIRRYDPPSGGPPGTPFGNKHTVYYEGTYGSNSATTPTERVLSEEEALFTRALNRGSNNTFDNNRGATLSNNIERIDFSFTVGSASMLQIWP